MDALASLSDSVAALAAQAAGRLFHVPSPLGGRTALGFDGKRLLVPARQAEKGEALELLAPGGASVAATVVGFDPGLGLAVLELAEGIPSSAWTPAKGLPALGSLVLAAAYPSPQGPEARLDLVRFSGGEDPYIQTDGSPFPGFAGGALVDAEGYLAGFLAMDRPGNRGWALPASKALELTRTIVERGFPSRAWLGISAVPIIPPAGFAEALGAEKDSALLVAAIEKDSPASRAELRVGDVLLTIGGAVLGDPPDLAAALDAAKPGESLAISVLRGGLRVELVAIPTADERGGEAGSWFRAHRRGRPWAPGGPAWAGFGCGDHGGPHGGPFGGPHGGPHGWGGGHGRGGHGEGGHHHGNGSCCGPER